MTDPRESLRAKLEHLQAEVGQIANLDPALAARLQSELVDVQAVLAGDAEQDANRPLSARFEDALVKIEASHPTLANTLAGLVDALGQMGL